MELHDLHDLYLDELKDLYSAERQILQALPKMAKAASTPQLKQAFEAHLEQTRGHVDRLKTIGERMKKRLTGKKCAAMEGLVKEGQELLEEEDVSPAVMDAALIAAAQRVEHYEMAGYGCVRTYAQALGETEAAELLQRTLDEEGETDKKLTQLAESVVNPKAKAA